MYKEHIETLARHKAGYNKTIVEACDAAIELMQAAEPKDAAAEREHCQTVAAEHVFDNGSVDLMQTAPTHLLLGDLLERERAQARAEGYAAGRQAAGDDWREVHRDTVSALETKLAAAQAEIERLNEDAYCVVKYAPVSGETATRIGELSHQLAAAQAKNAARKLQVLDTLKSRGKILADLEAAQERIFRLLEAQKNQDGLVAQLRDQLAAAQAGIDGAELEGK